MAVVVNNNMRDLFHIENVNVDIDFTVDFRPNLRLDVNAARVSSRTLARNIASEIMRAVDDRFDVLRTEIDNCFETVKGALEEVKSVIKS